MNAQRHLIVRNEYILEKRRAGVTVKALEEEFRKKYEETGKPEFKIKRFAFYQIERRYGFAKAKPITILPLKIGFKAPETPPTSPKASSEISTLSNSVKKNTLTVF